MWLDQSAAGGAPPQLGICRLCFSQPSFDDGLMAPCSANLTSSGKWTQYGGTCGHDPISSIATPTSTELPVSAPTAGMKRQTMSAGILSRRQIELRYRFDEGPRAVVHHVNGASWRIET